MSIVKTHIQKWLSSPVYWFLVVNATAISNMLHHFTPLSFTVPPAWYLLHTVNPENSSSSFSKLVLAAVYSRFFPGVLINSLFPSPLMQGLPLTPWYKLCKSLCCSCFLHFPMFILICSHSYGSHYATFVSRAHASQIFQSTLPVTAPETN